MNKPKWLFKLLSLVLLITAIVVAGLMVRDWFEFEKLNQLIQAQGKLAPIIFILIYACATVLFLPGSILTLTGGFVFGPILGLCYNLTGAVIGATVAFLIARYVASDWVAAKAGGKLKNLKDGVERQGWKFVAVVRLIPALPFNMLNYALGLTKVSVLGYVLASAVFMVPGAAAYTYLGHLGEEAVTGEPKEIITKIFIALSLLVFAAILPWLVKTLRKDKNDT